MDDPFRVLGVRPQATPGEIRAARLALVKALHPDVLGQHRPEARRAAERRLAEVNAAYDFLAKGWKAEEVTPADAATTGAGTAGAATAGTATAGTATAGAASGGEAVATFVVDAFRPVAFEALIVAAADVGDVTDADEPFSLEIHVEGPPTGFCRLELFPEAGGSVVTASSDAVDPSSIAGTLVGALVRLGVPAAVLAS